MTEESKVLLSVVLPAHNEAENVSAIADRLIEQANVIGKHEIIFVDDCSTDNTLGAIKELARRTKSIRYVALARNFGHQAALRAGLRHARGAAVVLMDCDFEHPPEMLPTLFAEWQNGAKIVLTKRQTSAKLHSPKHLTSSLFYRLLNAIGDVHIEPGSADFLLLDRKIVDIVNGFQNQDIFLRGLVRWLGFKHVTVPYTAGTRNFGEPSFTPGRMLELALTGIAAHSVKPLRLAIYLAFGFAVIGVLLVIYSVVSFIWIPHTVAGWTSIIGTIAILGAGQLLVLGVVSEYIGRILREARQWPAYVVTETDAEYADQDSVQPSREERTAL